MPVFLRQKQIFRVETKKIPNDEKTQFNNILLQKQHIFMR